MPAAPRPVRVRRVRHHRAGAGDPRGVRLIAYTIARQTREIGIRLAVGASRYDVLRMTVGMGIRWIGVGVCAGLLASLAATRVLGSQLWEVSPTDPLTLTTVIAVIAIAGFVASYLPALRATRVDPLIVLRAE